MENRIDRKPWVLTLLTVTVFLQIFLVTCGCSMFGKFKKADVYEGPQWISELRSTVENVVSDPDRAASMLALLDKMGEELSGMDAQVKQYMDRM